MTFLGSVYTMLSWNLWLVQCFYDGLTKPQRQMVDTSCRRTFMMKSENEEWTIFENLSENSVQHDSSSHRTPAPRAPKTKCLFAIGNPLDVTAKVGALSRKLDQLMVAGFVLTPHSSMPHKSCSLCSSPSHHASKCPTVGQCSNMSHEKVNVAFSKRGNDQYSNSYNSGWRNHTNFSLHAQALGNSAPPHGLHD